MLTPFLHSACALSGFHIKIYKTERNRKRIIYVCNSATSSKSCSFRFAVHFQADQNSPLKGLWYITDNGFGYKVHSTDNHSPLLHPLSQRRSYSLATPSQKQSAILDTLPFGLLEQVSSKKAYGSCREKKHHMAPTDPRFNKANPLPICLRVGTYPLGFVYQQNKKIHHIAAQTQKSQEHSGFLSAVQDSLVSDGIIRQSPQELSLCLSIIKGPYTACHLDKFGGVSLSYLIFLNSYHDSEPSSTISLSINTFPSYKCSIVKYKGKMYIPFTYLPGQNNIVLIGFANNSSSLAYLVYPDRVVNYLQPYVDLNVAIAAIKGTNTNSLQCVPLKYDNQVYSKSSELLTLTFDQLLLSHIHREASIPEPRIITHSIPNQWFTHEGWRHIHCITGNALIPRINAFQCNICFPLPAAYQTKHKTLYCDGATSHEKDSLTYPFWPPAASLVTDIVNNRTNN